MKKIILLTLLFYPIILKAQNCLTQGNPKTKGIVKVGSVNLPTDSLLKSPVLSFQKNGKEIFIGFFGIKSLHENEVDNGKMVLVMKFKNQKSKIFKSLSR